jgi:hypothetical protein
MCTKHGVSFQAHIVYCGEAHLDPDQRECTLAFAHRIFGVTYRGKPNCYELKAGVEGRPRGAEKYLDEQVLFPRRWGASEGAEEIDWEMMRQARVPSR